MTEVEIRNEISKERKTIEATNFEENFVPELGWRVSRYIGFLSSSN